MYICIYIYIYIYICENVKRRRLLFARDPLRRIAGSFRRVLLGPKGRSNHIGRVLLLAWDQAVATSARLAIWQWQ